MRISSSVNGRGFAAHATFFTKGSNVHNSIYEIQQQRKRNEKYQGPWDQTRDAIIAARGAREGVVEERGFLTPMLAEKADVLIYAASEKTERTLVDSLWEDMQAGVGDER